jgi:hypothetical protein
MVLTLLRGLNGQFRHMVSILKMHRPFPTFSEARTHLRLEEMEIEARPPSPPSALVATAPRPVAPGTAAPPRPGTPTPPPVRPPAAPSTPNPGTGGQRNGRRRSRGGSPTPTGGCPPGLHPSYTHPWAGTVQMWPYNRFGRPLMAPPAFTAIPQFDGNFCSNPGGAYGPHLLSTGEPHLHHQYYRHIRRPRHHPGPRPGTPPTRGRGTRTPWRTRSTP